jgi:hypothetical protein
MGRQGFGSIERTDQQSQAIEKPFYLKEAVFAWKPC